MSTKPRKCFKCRGDGKFQWRICSDGPWRWVCKACDLELNWIALKWAFGERVAIKKFEKYKAMEVIDGDVP